MPDRVMGPNKIQQIEIIDIKNGAWSMKIYTVIDQRAKVQKTGKLFSSQNHGVNNTKAEIDTLMNYHRNRRNKQGSKVHRNSSRESKTCWNNENISRNFGDVEIIFYWLDRHLNIIKLYFWSQQACQSKVWNWIDV